MSMQIIGKNIGAGKVERAKLPRSTWTALPVSGLAGNIPQDSAGLARLTQKEEKPNDKLFKETIGKDKFMAIRPALHLHQLRC